MGLPIGKFVLWMLSISSMITVDDSYYVHARYDGNKTIGYRLYRELNIYPSKRNSKGKGCLTPSAINFQWETLATNLEEFRKVVVRLNFLVCSGLGTLVHCLFLAMAGSTLR